MKQPYIMVWNTLEQQYYQAQKKDLFSEGDLITHMAMLRTDVRKALNDGMAGDKELMKIDKCIDFIMEQHEPQKPHYNKTYIVKEQLFADKDYMERYNYVPIIKLPNTSKEFVVVNWLKRFS